MSLHEVCYIEPQKGAFMQPSISLNEASKMANVSTSTIRRWIKIGRLKASQNKQGNWQVDSQNLLSTLGSNPPSQGASMKASQAPNDDAKKLLEATVEALRREREINDELRSENRQLHAEIRALLEQKSSSKLGQMISRWVRV